MIKLNSKNWQVPKYQIREFFPKKNNYCLVIPVINEGEKFLAELKDIKKYSRLIDILICDGGSTDGSTNPNLLKELNVRVLLIGPLGQAKQYRFGFDFALRQGYLGIVTIDGNHKDDVSSLPNFIKALAEGLDFVQGSRFIKGGKHQNTPLDRLFFNRFIISPLLSLVAGHWYTDTPNAFRAYSRKYLLHPRVQPFRNIFERYEMLWYLTIRANQLKLISKEIPVTRVYPKGKIPTKIVGWKKITDFMNIFRIALGFYNP